MKGHTGKREQRKGKQPKPYWRWNEKKKWWEHPKWQENKDEPSFFKRLVFFIFGLYVPSVVSLPAMPTNDSIDYYVQVIDGIAKRVVKDNNSIPKGECSMGNLPTNRKPGEKYASSLWAGMKVWMDGKPVKLTNVVNESSGGGLGLTRLYWDGGKSDGVCNRIVLLAPDDLDDFVQDLDMSGL